MAEGTYEHACMRAELLGLDKPDKEEFYRHNPQRVEEADAAQFEDISLQNDELQHVTGGINELNTILSGTQRKLNRLKGMCGSLTDLLKNKLGGSKDDMSYSTDPSYLPAGGSGPSNKKVDINQAIDDLDTMKAKQNTGMGSELHQQISSQVNKLDSLLNKAENAEIAMQQQNKQMKSILHK